MESRRSGSTEELRAREELERFREAGISVDRAGRFWHQGEEVTHPGLRAAFLRWIDRLEDGRHVLRLEADRYVYLEVEDSPLLVTAVRWIDDRAEIGTNDGAVETLDATTLAVGENNALYCEARGGKLEARFATAAYYAVAERIEEEPTGDFALVTADGRFPVRRRQR